MGVPPGDTSWEENSVLVESTTSKFLPDSSAAVRL